MSLQDAEKLQMNELDWIQIRNDISDTPVETFKEKIIRKTSENPLVPLGTLVTTAALTYGIYNFYIGNSQMSQYMMRARVGAQAFTIAAMVGGIFVASTKK